MSHIFVLFCCVGNLKPHNSQKVAKAMISGCGFLLRSNTCFMTTYFWVKHYNDVIMSATASQTTSLTIVYSSVYSGEDQRKHKSSASLAFLRGIHLWPGNSPHKSPATRKMFPFDDVITGWLVSSPVIQVSDWRLELHLLDVNLLELQNKTHTLKKTI